VCAEREVPGSKRLVLLIAIMVLIAIAAGGTVMTALYVTAFEEKRADLVRTAQSQARLTEAIFNHQKEENF
jgi:flagellar basal body-associated protein FliL